MGDKVKFWVNGEQVIFKGDTKANLLDFLRNQLHLKGAKNGCGKGQCGTCTVIIDGKPMRACQIRLARMDGKRVETIEGLAPKGNLHPIQSAFIKTGAVQCGFCTPGVIMGTKALLDQNPDPSISEIKQALKHNICRCTGYVKIIDAVKLAAKNMQFKKAFVSLEEIDQSARIGQSIPDYDAIQKVRGELLFAGDLEREEMLYGKVLWSKYPHAKIKKINDEKAQNIKGIRAIFTAKDIPGLKYFGRVKPDQPIICSDEVRFLGEVVAVAFAENIDVAKEAVKLIEVEYEELPGIFSLKQVSDDGASVTPDNSDICKHFVHEIGDIQEGRKKSDIVVSGHFRTPAVDPAYLEPDAGLAVYMDGVLTVYLPTQAPFEIHDQIAKALNLPLERVRVIVTPLGGSYGGKTEGGLACLLALGAFKLNEPVKITFEREETLRVGTKKHPFEMDYEVGANKEGKLQFVKAKLVADAGPYTTATPRVLDQAAIFACGPYEVPNAYVEALALYTNNANGGPMRGYGINQVAFAVESLLDELSRKLGIDPFELRRRNALDIGKRTFSGQFLNASVGIKATIDRCEEALAREIQQYRILYENQPTKKLGVGIASAFKNVGSGKGKPEDAGAIFILERDGSVLVRVSGVDMGQGFRTAMLQIAVEATRLSPKLIKLITGDTLLTHKHSSATGQRQILISGNAVRLAGQEFKNELLSRAAKIAGHLYEDLELHRQGVVSKVSQQQIISLEELAQALPPAEKIKGECEYLSPPTYALSDTEARKRVPPEEYRNFPSHAYTTHVALVEVDTVSGQVKVLKIIAAHDVGVAINPQKIEGQIEGSCLMGLGYALSEEFIVAKGIFKTRFLKDCGIPTILDMPSIEVIVIEDPEPLGPYGAKGISEVATVPTTPAILNAIYDAIGKRFYSIPVKPEKILRALNE